MKHLFIINPVAGGVRGHTQQIEAAIRAVFDGSGENYELYTTAGPMDAVSRIAGEADFCSALRVYACGGDGTLNECVNGAAGHGNVEVCPYPVGTGNDFVKTFGKDAKAIFTDLPALVRAKAYPTDLIRCNERLGLNICSVGIDARIGGDVHKYSSIPVIGGATGYVTSLAVNLFKGINQHCTLRCGEFEYTGTVSLVCACNGTHYGGGFNPVPEASPADGLLNFLVVRGVSRTGFLKAVGRYSKGRYRELPELITPLIGTEMEMICDETQVVNVDGEIVTASSIRFSVVPGGVRLVVPDEIVRSPDFPRLYPSVRV